MEELKLRKNLTTIGICATLTFSNSETLVHKLLRRFIPFAFEKLFSFVTSGQQNPELVPILDSLCTKRLSRAVRKRGKIKLASSIILSTQT